MTAPAPGSRWVLDLPWSRPPLSLNDRRGTHAHAAVVREVRGAGGMLARSARVPGCGRVLVELHWVPGPRVSVVDEENPVPTMKALCDGLVDAGVVADDDRWRMSKLMPVIHDRAPSRTPGRMWLVVEVLPELVDAPPARRQPAPAVGRPRSKRGSSSSPASAGRRVPVVNPMTGGDEGAAWRARVEASMAARRGGRK